MSGAVGILVWIDGTAKVGLKYAVTMAEIVITAHDGTRWRVTGWDQTRQAFECERVDADRAPGRSEG